MKREIFLRSILGFPIGLAIGYLITIVISLIWSDGYYYSCVPGLIEMMGNEINAVLLQAVLCGAIGVGFSATSVIWKIESWGIAKQTLIYFLINSAIMMPVAYVTRWMEHSLKGILSYFGIFAFIFVIIWVIEYTIARHNVAKMNETLRERQNRK